MPQLSYDFIETFKKIPKLTALEIDISLDNQDLLITLFTHLQHSNTLHQLTLNLPELMQFEQRYFGELLLSYFIPHKNLQSLQIKINGELKNALIEKLSLCLNRHPSMKKLHLVYDAIEPTLHPNVFNSLMSIQYLSLHSKTYPTELSSVAELICRENALHTLILHYPHIEPEIISSANDSFALEIASALMNNKTLKSLTMTLTTLSPNTILEITQTLSTNKTLEHLSFITEDNFVFKSPLEIEKFKSLINQSLSENYALQSFRLEDKRGNPLFKIDIDHHLIFNRMIYHNQTLKALLAAIREDYLLNRTCADHKEALYHGCKVLLKDPNNRKNFFYLAMIRSEYPIYLSTYHKIIPTNYCIEIRPLPHDAYEIMIHDVKENTIFHSFELLDKLLPEGLMTLIMQHQESLKL
jgi:hypothetical protein